MTEPVLAPRALVTQEALKLLWHYTVGMKMPAIVRSGVLKPAVAFVPEGEIPVVWFSSEPRWEQTANKMLMTAAGQLVCLNFEQTVMLFGGGYRFGVPAHQLLSWPKLKTVARIHPDTERALVCSAKDLGANPDTWAGAIEPVSVSACRVERLTDAGWLLV
jgi:hypothetical protein